MTEENKDGSTSRTRRKLLKEAGAAAGGLGAGAAVGEAVERAGEALESDEKARSLMPVVGVRAATPGDDDYGQYRGGSKRQGVFDSTFSATGKQGEQSYHSGKNLIQAPVTDGQGNVMSQSSDTMYGVNLDTEETFSAPAEGEWQIISDGEHAYTGDGTDLIKVKIPDGSVIQRNTDALGGGTIDTAPFAKYGDTGYIGTSDGVGQINLNNLDKEKEFEFGPGSGSPSTILVYDNGEKLLLDQQGTLITYDPDSESRIDTKLGNIENVAAFDDDTFAALDSTKLYLLDENLDEIDSVDASGQKFAPPTPFTEDDGTKKIYSVKDGGVGDVEAYSLNSGSLEKEWSTNLGGAVGEFITYGDSLIIDGENGIKALNREDGNVLWEKSDAGSFVGMPYNETIPYAPENEGLVALDVETGQIGDAPAELVHSWDGIPSSMTVGEGATWHHVLEETGGESPVTGVQVVYEIEAENGEPYQVVAPLELNPGQVMERDFSYSPIREEDGSFQGEFHTDINEVEVQHPVDITGGQTEVTLKATPEDGATSSERLL